MKILHIVYSLIRGGTEGQCARIAMGMSRRGSHHKVVVFKREGFFLPMIEATCGAVMQIDIKHMISFVTLQEIYRLRVVIRAESIDLVHCWDADAAIFGSLAARWAGAPYVTSRRDLGEIYPAYKLWLMHMADRKAAGVVLNAKAIKQHSILRYIDPKKLFLINNMVDLKEFDHLSQNISEYYVPSGRNVVMVARLDKEKSVDSLIKAFNQVGKRHRDVNLIIVGDGRERKYLERLAEELGIRKQVCFMGERNDVPSILLKCDIGVLTPSSNEGLSNTILEYMAASLPVVATNCGGNSELIANDENGYVVPIGDEIAITNALIKLLDNKEMAQKMGNKGRLRVETDFSIHAVVPVFEQLYQSII